MKKTSFDVNKFLTEYTGKQIQTKDIADYLNYPVRNIQNWCGKNNIEFMHSQGRKYYIWNTETIKKFAEYYNRFNGRKSRYYYYKPSILLLKKRFIKEVFEGIKWRMKIELSEEKALLVLDNYLEYIKENSIKNNQVLDITNIDTLKYIFSIDKFRNNFIERFTGSYIKCVSTKRPAYQIIADIIDDINMFYYEWVPEKHLLKEVSKQSKAVHIRRWCLINKIPYEYHYGRRYFIITDETKDRIKDFFENDDWQSVYLSNYFKRVRNPNTGSIILNRDNLTIDRLKRRLESLKY